MSVIYQLPSQILSNTKFKQCFRKWREDENTMCAGFLVCDTLGYNPTFKEPMSCAPCVKKWNDLIKFEDLRAFLVHYNDLHRLSFKEIADVVRGIGY